MLPEDQLASLPEDIRSDPSWEKFNDLKDIPKSYVELQKMNGNALRIPDENATPEDVEKWKGDNLPKLAARGMIDLPAAKAEDYKLPTIEGAKFDDGLVNSFVKEVALETKMTPKQFEAVVAFQHKMGQEYQKNIMTPESADAEFRTMMGNEYVPTMEVVNNTLNALSADNPVFADVSKRAYVTMLDKDGKPGKSYPFTNAPIVRGMLELMGGMTQEDNSRGGNAPNGNQSKEAMQSEIDTLMASDKFKRGDQTTVDRIDELRKKIWGTAQV